MFSKWVRPMCTRVCHAYSALNVIETENNNLTAFQFENVLNYLNTDHPYTGHYPKNSSTRKRATAIKNSTIHRCELEV